MQVECKFICDDETVVLQHNMEPKYISEWGTVYEGLFHSQKVIVKVSKLKHENKSEDARREKCILEKLQCKAVRIFMGLLASFETSNELFLVLEKASIDLFDFLEKAKELSKKESMYIVFLLAKLTNRLHETGIVHCDISLENVVMYMSNGECHVAFIDAAQAQEPNPNDEFDVNVLGRAHVFDGKPLGKTDYETPDACFKRPFKLRKADIFAMKVVMWQTVFGAKPFTIVEDSKSIGPIEKREKFFCGKLHEVATKEQQAYLGNLWEPFCNFLASSTESFDIDHELFLACAENE